MTAGRDGVAAISRIAGLARSTITRSLAQLRGDALPEAASDRIRRDGDRRSLAATDATLLADLKDLIEPATCGDPKAPLLWTAKSLRDLASGHRMGHDVVADLLRQTGYTLRADRKTRKGTAPAQTRLSKC